MSKVLEVGKGAFEKLRKTKGERDARVQRVIRLGDKGHRMSKVDKMLYELIKNVGQRVPITTFIYNHHNHRFSASKYILYHSGFNIEHKKERDQITRVYHSWYRLVE